MKYEIKEVSFDHEDFKKLCKGLDDFQNSFSTYDEGIQNKIQEKLVFMRKDI